MIENVLPKYVRPIAKIDDPVNIVDYWDTGVDAFDEKDYKKSVINIVKYINSNLIDDDKTEGDIEIVQMQGSAEIYIKITDTTFSIKAPFLRIGDKTNRVALLRRVAEVNFSPLRLEQIHLKNDELHFEYDMPIELAQPNKVYDIIRNVALFADKYDDEFVENYQAEFIHKPNYTELSQEEKDIVWQQISDVFEDYKNYSELFKEKRWDDFIWDILVISFLKISNMPYVHGKLRSDLIYMISLITDGDSDFNYRVDKGVNFMKKLMDKSREEIMKNVYHADQLISLRWRSNEQIITDRLNSSLESVQNDEKKERYFNVSYFLQYLFLRLIYDYNLEDSYKTAIYDVLEAVSGLEPEEAAPKLIALFYKMYKGEINKKEEIKDEKKDKGFFSKLFS